MYNRFSSVLRFLIGGLPVILNEKRPWIARSAIRQQDLFLHSSTIVSVADLTHPNLPVYNKLIFAKK